MCRQEIDFSDSDDDKNAPFGCVRPTLKKEKPTLNSGK